MIPKIKKFILFASLALVFFAPKISFAEASLIRDAETEKFLHNLADPIFRAANLNPENIKIYIINDDSINAFVSGGQNVFINTGLIRKYKKPDALIGVIAHETGHIAAGHLARASEEMQKTQNSLLLTYLLGIGAAIGGSPEAGQAIILGGSNSVEKLYMKYNRGQEEAADLHALEYLDKISYPADGLVNLLEFFQREMIGYQGQIDEYAMSHPVSKKRINAIKAFSLNKNYSDKKINQPLQETMDRVLAKLEAFMENPDEILKKYQNQNSELANYSKSIAYFRKGNSSESLNLLNEIINKNSKDGFLFELKGQILFESGQITESIIAYNQALKLLGPTDAAQTKIAFASAILSLSKNDEDLIKIAIKNLSDAKKYEGDNTLLFKQLASAYSKINDEGRSFLALAEFNFLRGDEEKTTKYAKKAKEKLPKTATEELLRADDLLDLTKKKKLKNSTPS